MNFVSFDKLKEDVLAWERTLPLFDIVVGIPRSGLIPAAYLALKRNIRYVEFEHFLQDPDKAVASAIVRKINPLFGKEVGNRVLIVDDSAGKDCNTIRHFKAKLDKHSAYDISFGVVYAEATNPELHFFHRLLSKPRIFEWNVFRHYILGHSLLDIDGVVCEDWTGKETDNDSVYLNHVRNVRPLHVPQLPVLGFVTGRLEKYRDHTNNWLLRHDIRYQQLHMYDAETPAQRRQAGDAAIRKAQVYSSYPRAKLFIESSYSQATKIFEITRKPVLCIDTMTMFS
jgi:uncharacterized HAD superfamily protein/hypoxanthine phosphoribosyltransferase